MKTIIRILLSLAIVVVIISLYWSVARYSDLIFVDILEKDKWGNIAPLTTFLLGILTITILWINLKFYEIISRTINSTKSVKIGLYCSLFFLLLATLFWSNSWSATPNYSVPDARELGDGMFSLGHPLTFLIVDLPIYIRYKYRGFENYWSDYWAYPAVVILFITQFSIYVQGIRLLFNYNEMKNEIVK